MEDKFGKMSIDELEELKRNTQNELNIREKNRKQKVLEYEEAEAGINLSRIDILLSICSHTEGNKCSDDNITEDIYRSYEYPAQVRCTRCYLLSCKEYHTPPNFKISAVLENYEVFGR